MNEHRFLNRSQPQTLYMATILCYIDAVFNLIGVGGNQIFLVVAAALAGGAYGIANEKKWGYSLAVGGAILQILILLRIFGASTFTAVGPLLDFLFDGALVALLLHPMSRDYQRIWFR